MKPARVIILTVAVVAAGLAGLLAMRLSGGGPVQQETREVIRKEPTVNVLVSAQNLSVGSRLSGDMIRWMAWPQSGVTEGFITEAARPQAVTELAGAIVRLPMFAGEPVRAEKIADASNRIMSSILPSGKRAVATEISVATGAGGFVLPNDRVDVIMVRKNDEGRFLTESVLTNIRVLAIDQHIQEKDDGTKSVVGTTATLELTPDQAKVIAVAQQMADRLTLALRSIADVQEPDTAAPDYLLAGSGGKGEVQVIKSGAIVTGGGGAMGSSSSSSSSSSAAAQR
ncbi:Flp pilus assembly protein CpaB [Rhizobium sp. SSA_523]|uniref:Flp pilus assembly protein CpaB n=1 Tax=Rhizobium sp. SSA_523 TaxID=2952477 RepID=UPI00209170AE|nr:Flp pilus assembly protein CpaB [Rhizobium sp. SSA_523]MCO5732782.1 Flp pilus assembly protein CpaB [Rhizobium sp. SSA_523]WKC23600.1 Flp pilus assembly protein CpaB [Rhizobium sp. SSA_523]